MHCPQVPPLCQGPRFGLANTDFTLNISSDVAAVISWAVEANNARGQYLVDGNTAFIPHCAVIYSVLQQNNAGRNMCALKLAEKKATASNGSKAPYQPQPRTAEITAFSILPGHKDQISPCPHTHSYRCLILE